MKYFDMSILNEQCEIINHYFENLLKIYILNFNLFNR